MRLAFAGGPTISVEGANAGVETWLGEYFAAALTDRAPAPPSGRLVVVQSASERQRWRATRTAEARLLPVFAVEREMVERDGWEHDGTIVVDYEDRGYVLLLDGDATTVVLDPDAIRPRFVLVLVLYELVALAMRPTWLELHAASVVIDGHAHLVIGPKGAGKTTLSLALVRAGGGLLGNDRAFARPDGIVGMPTPVKLLPDTMAAFPQLATEPAPPDAYMFTVDEMRAERGELLPGEPLIFQPAEAIRRLGALPVSGVHPPGTLVFPEVVPALDGIESVPLEPSEVEARLLANLYRAAPADREPTLFERLAGGRPTVPTELAGELARQRPAHRVRLGASALGDPTLTRSIVDVAACP